ncbi:MAG: dihydroorotate dehydrogenase electron transfer subunit [Clostridia bacterium]|nr:dihydroorotate dehydrogenase electron transfer subunit [Clostridia bacterium]
MISERAQITLNRQVGIDIWQMRLQTPQIAKAARAGQFVMLQCGTGLDPFLKRPLGIHEIAADFGVITCVYRVVGRGTGLLSKLPVGSQITVLGPCGRPWPQLNAAKAVIIGGGMGIAPLLPLAEDLSARGNTEIYLGANSSDELFALVDFAKCGNLRVATLDGSAGVKGFVTELLPTDLSATEIFACGPLPMMKAVAELAARQNINCWLSLEEHMGCGIGTCMGCVRPIKENDKIVYKRVCREGPVFNATEVVFDD